MQMGAAITANLQKQAIQAILEKFKQNKRPIQANFPVNAKFDWLNQSMNAKQQYQKIDQQNLFYRGLNHNIEISL